MKPEPTLYSNQTVVRALRMLADDLDEPGADDWDEGGVYRAIAPAIIDRLERADEEERRSNPPIPFEPGDRWNDGGWEDVGGFPIPAGELPSPRCDRTCLSCQGDDHAACGMGCHDEDDCDHGDGCDCCCQKCQQLLTGGDLTYYHRGGCPAKEDA